MASFQITRNMTCDDDSVWSSQNGFPMVYVGRGTYSGVIDIFSQSVMTGGKNEVQLIYIGRYTSIGDKVILYCNMNHDYKSVYMGVITDFADDTDETDYRKTVGQAHGNLKEKGTIIIGNDVWIGDKVTVIADCIIGNGAVIGAGSVIAKDIPPYTIWAGNPAVQIGERFDSGTIDKFKKIAWWEFSRNKIASMRDDMQGNVLNFVNKYIDKVAVYRK